MATSMQSAPISYHDKNGSYLLVQLNVLHDFQSQREVAQKAVYAEQADKAKVAKHAVEWATTILSDNPPTLMSEFTLHAHKQQATYTISSALLPSCRARICSLIFDFWISEYRTLSTLYELHTWPASARSMSSSSVFDLTFDRQTQKDWN